MNPIARILDASWLFVVWQWVGCLRMIFENGSDVCEKCIRNLAAARLRVRFVAVLLDRIYLLPRSSRVLAQ